MPPIALDPEVVGSVEATPAGAGTAGAGSGVVSPEAGEPWSGVGWAPDTGPSHQREAPPARRIHDRSPPQGHAGARWDDLREGLQTLIDHLEETTTDDQDYYIDSATIELMAQDGAPASLVELLRRAVGGRDGIEIQWTRR